MFKKKIRTIPKPKDINVLDGTAIESKGLYFYVKGGKKYRISSERVLLSQRYPRVISVTPACANRIPNVAAKIGFREGQVVKDISTNLLYVISGNKTRKIATPDFVTTYDIQDKDILVISHEELLLHEGGEDINGL